MQQLDDFFKSLGIKDFTSETNSADDYIAPQLRASIVREQLTDDIIIDNAHIVAIVRDPVTEQSNYLAKTSQNASDSVENLKHYDSSLDTSKTAESAIETSARRTNRFRP
jgi:hypothetical protein